MGGPALPAIGHAVAGSTGAAISNVLTYPLSLVVTRLQIQGNAQNVTEVDDTHRYRSVHDAITKIYSLEGGVKALYTGLISDTSKTVVDAFLFFLAYNFFRQRRIRALHPKPSHLPVSDELGVGFLAGAFSKFLTTPIANIVTQKQAASMRVRRSSSTEIADGSIRSIALRIQSETGLHGFWSGYSASLFLTLNPSLTFFFFETLKRTLLPRSKRSNPPPHIIFFLAACSKAMASTITYPFSLAKSRAQASSSRTTDGDWERRKECSGTKSKDSSTRSNRRETLFTTLACLVQAEGISALYEGLGGELVKGFFSHGLTMMLKDRTHKSVIHTYYAVLKLLDRYPSSPALAQSVKE